MKLNKLKACGGQLQGFGILIWTPLPQQWELQNLLLTVFVAVSEADSFPPLAAVMVFLCPTLPPGVHSWCLKKRGQVNNRWFHFRKYLLHLQDKLLEAQPSYNRPAQCHCGTHSRPEAHWDVFQCFHSTSAPEETRRSLLQFVCQPLSVWQLNNRTHPAGSQCLKKENHF